MDEKYNPISMKSEMERQYKQDGRWEIIMLIRENGLVEGDLVDVDNNVFSIMSYTLRQLKRGGWPSRDARRVIGIAGFSEYIGGVLEYSHFVATCDSVLRGKE